VDSTSTRSVARPFSATANTAIGAADDLYFSGLVQVAEEPALSGATFFGIGTNLLYDATPSSGVYVSVGNSGLQLSYVNTSSSFTNSVVVNSASLATNSTYLFLVGIEKDYSGTTDRITLSVFDTDDTYTSPTFAQSFDASVDFSDLTHLVVSQSNISGYTNNDAAPRFDEFYLGTSQADVMAVPEPSTGLSFLAGFGALGFFRRRIR